MKFKNGILLAFHAQHHSSENNSKNIKIQQIEVLNQLLLALLINLFSLLFIFL